MVTPRTALTQLVLLSGMLGSAWTGVPLAQTSGRTPVAEFAAAIQTRYDEIGDFSAAFVQTYAGGLLRTMASERGTVLIKKPGKMRWAYAEQERKVFVSDGVRLYSYVPADKQVVVSQVPPADQAGAPVLLLAGNGSLTRDFDVQYADALADDDPATVTLELTPKVSDPSYDTLMLIVEEATLQIRGLVTLDTQGGTSMLTFTNIRENLGISDSSFSFEIPRGVDVIHTDAVQ